MDEKSIELALSRIPYAATLGVKPLLMGKKFTLILPFVKNNIGNPLLPALHGGAIGGFMEIAAITESIIRRPNEKFPKPIGINVNYLRRGNPVDTYARAKITRQGTRVTNVRVTAWQDDIDDPIATLHGHFLTAQSEN